MKAVILALVLGMLLNTSSVNGQPWSLGSVAAVIVMGVWIKTSMDRRFDALEVRLERGQEPSAEKQEGKEE